MDDNMLEQQLDSDEVWPFQTTSSKLQLTLAHSKLMRPLSSMPSRS
jgi:hypothetical protein